MLESASAADHINYAFELTSPAIAVLSEALDAAKWLVRRLKSSCVIGVVIVV